MNTNNEKDIDFKLQKVINKLNNTKTEYPSNKTVIELFEEQVEKNPDKIAVKSKDNELTYKELNEKSNALARRLRELGVKPNEFVGIVAERNINTVIGWVAILKAGAAYMPISVDFPKERIEYLINDSNCKIIITGEEELKTQDLEVSIEKVSLLDNKNFTESVINISKVNTGEDLAYLIYTSGTTGKPKGVMIKHKSINRLVKNTNYVNFDNVRILQMGSLTFDASTFEIWGSLLNGGTVYIAEKEILADIKLFKETIKKNNINTLFITVALFNQFISIDVSAFDDLTQLYFGGDAASEKHVRMLIHHNKNIKVYNGYGPTEVTTFALFHKVSYEDTLSKIPIGKPLSNTTAYILKDNKLCPLGVVGELFLGGPGVAKGYLNDEKKTADKFINNPYNDGEIIYRTGDLALLREDGNIEYLGRIDNQVKIRGFRIELGEVESKLKEIKEVKDAKVIVKKRDQDKCLCAYIILNDGLDVEDIKNKLGEKVPKYMVPSIIMKVKSFPLTKNGKIDISALPEPEFIRKTEYVTPRNNVEKCMVDVFSDVLGVKRIGINESFFELGGDSIKAIRIVSKLHDNGYEITVKDIMQNKYIQEISPYINKIKEMEIDQGEVTGTVSLTPIQKELFEKDLENPNYSTISFLLESKEIIHKKCLEKSLTAIVKHHDMLRTVYRDYEQRIQSFEESKLFDLYYFDYTNLKDEIKIDTQINYESKEIQKNIDLANGPLLKVGMFHTNTKDYIFICIHQLVVDVISCRIIAEDLNLAYKLAKENKEILLSPKTMSFPKWSEYLREYNNSFMLKREIPYWKNVAQNIVKGRILYNGDVKEKGIGSAELKLSQAETYKLLGDVNKAYNTGINDLLLVSLARAVNELTGNVNVSVSIEGNGRNLPKEKVTIDRTVGCFTSIYPVNFKNIGKSIEKDIVNVKETFKSIPNHGIGYSVLKSFNKEMFSHDEPDILFNYIGEFNHDTTMDYLVMSVAPYEKVAFNENRFGHRIIIDSYIVNGSLKFIINFNKSLYNEGFMNEFVIKYKEKLIEIINHCSSVAEFKNTASDFGEYKWSNAEFSKYQNSLKDKNYKIERIYPLTGIQEGMLFHKLMNKDTTEYVVQSIYKSEKTINQEILKDSIKVLEEKYEVLRTSIVYKEVSKPRQILLKGRPIELVSIDLSENTEKQIEFKHIINEDVKRGFDLQEDRLLRLMLIKLENNDYRLVITFHHIILDGWCLSILINDIKEIYTKLVDGEKTEKLIKSLTKNVPFEDYVRLINDKDNSEGLKYWKELLADYDEKAEIKPEGILEKVNNEVNSVELSLSAKQTKDLEKVSGKYGVTVNTIIEAVWSVILQRYNNSNDVTFGKVVSGRNVKLNNVDDIVGIFINTIPVRVKTELNDKFSDVLKRIQEQAIRSLKYDYCTLSDIQAQSDLGKDLIQTIVGFENYYVHDSDDNSKLKIKLDRIREATNYPLSFDIIQSDVLNFKIMYDTKKYNEDEVRRILYKLETVINNIIDNPEVQLKSIEVLNKDEKQKILYEFNDTKAEYPNDKTIIELFEEQVKNNPNNIAVEYENESITYNDLNERANYIGQALREISVNPDDVVAIICDKSIEMILAIISVLKSGGAYMPIDAEQPVDRINFMLKDSKAKAILSGVGSNKIINSIKKNIPVINLREEKGVLKNNLNHVSTSNSLAYIIFTSGSTGTPKGVMLENKGVVNLSYWRKNIDKLTSDSVVLQNFNYIFDGSVWDIFPCLLAGGKLRVVSKEERNNFDKLLKLLNKASIIMVPSLFRSILEYADTPEKIEKLNSFSDVHLGAEALSKDIIEKYIEIDKDKLQYMYNNYGPTEATVCSTFFNLKGVKNTDIIPIGKPISNTQVYIMNNENLCGIGMPGELCIGGDGLARGYLNREDLTKEKFINNPFGKGRIYRTGDLAKWLPDGNIEYLGRIDKQVKIRGFRIELGEIENRIRELEGIQDVVVLANDDVMGDKYLCAFVVSKVEFNAKDIKDELRKNLPKYMVPSYFKRIESIPRTINGKIDTKSLLEIKIIKSDLKDYVAPRNKIQQDLIEAWEKVTSVKGLGIMDEYFDYGGTSIKAIQFVLQLSGKYKININDVFECTTIEELSERVNLAHNSLFNIEMKEVDEKGDLFFEKNEEYKLNNKKYSDIDLSVKKDYKEVLLTGATGYLGINLLADILKGTNLNVNIIVRALSKEEAVSRIKASISYYFDRDFYEEYKERISIYNGNLIVENFDLSDEEYKDLAKKVDCIINSAANVKHYGEYETFYNINFKAVKLLVDFAKRGKVKDIHHISTLSVGEGNVANKNKVFFTEYDFDLGQSLENYYIKTKYLAEELLFKSRAEGLNINIYRVGNLVFNSNTGVFQKNISENAFYSVLRANLKLKIMQNSSEGTLEFSYVNETSKAIVLLFDKLNLNNEVFHIFNENHINVNEFNALINKCGLELKLLGINEYEKELKKKYEDESSRKYVEDLLMHTQNLAEDISTKTIFLNKKTSMILKKLGFKWSALNKDKIQKMLSYCDKVKFL
ncbi:MAG: amino acid adenylation domain-containing protein [Clostridium sp.]|nr:amino acid adenylation domain-containing protein [Clostridium sp.]